jgi:hypothetical protein
MKTMAKVSKQRRWQIAKLEAGRCAICGKNGSITNTTATLAKKASKGKAQINWAQTLLRKQG